jgi:ABC-type polysaccharide/polyol phosphate export permease
VVTDTADIVYDSSRVRRPIVSEVRNTWTYRGLLRLLVRRDLTLRYKRSFLGVGWSLLNPLITSAVMWFIFSQVFARSAREDVPFIVWLLSGITLVAFFSQGIVASGSSLVTSRGIITKVYVPPEIFAFSTAIAAGVNFLIMMIPLLALQIFTGIGIPWTVFLVPIPAIATLLTVAGVGLMLAAAAVHFYDIIEMTKVLATLLTWMVPTFYTLAMIPTEYHWVIKANPVYSYLVIFRGFVWGGEFAPWWNWVVMIATTLIVLALGAWIFGRSWKNVVARL